MGEAGGTERCSLGAVEDVLGGEVLVGGEGVEAFEEAAVNGGGRFTVELLVDDALGECFKRGLGAGDPHDEGAGALDEATEFGVGGGELAAGEGEVVAGWTQGVARSRHDSR